MKHYAGKTYCSECGTTREVEYDEEADETRCKHCKEIIVPKAQRLSSHERSRLTRWKEHHRPDACPTR